MYCNAQKPQYIELFQMLLTDEFICKKKGPGSHMSIFLKHPLADVFVGKILLLYRKVLILIFRMV